MCIFILFIINIYILGIYNMWWIDLIDDGIHPNDYKLTATEEGVDQILINEQEIERFLLNICKK